MSESPAVTAPDRGASPTAPCPCGRDATFASCCGPYVRGDVHAPTAEALMRSRYTAYATGVVDHVVRTTWPALQKGLDPKGIAKWSRDSTWQGLDIVKTERGGEADDTGLVEFRARYRDGTGDQVHHELAEFKRQDGHWFFFDGKPVKAPPVRVAPKPGRNEPCTCGSGKKYKKCCGAAA